MWRRSRPAAWRTAGRLAPWALALLVLGLLARQAQGMDWSEVWHALHRQPPVGLAGAAGLALLSHALFASYDLVGRHETRHRLSAPHTLGIAAVCYAFNLNFGALVGALALRLRLYTRAGLRASTAARVIVLGVATNWLGYAVVGGLALALAPPPLPPQLPFSATDVRLLGVALLLPGLAYLGLCRWSRRRHFTLRGHRFDLPAGRIALWQLAVSALNWSLMGAIVWVLLQQRVDYPTVLAVLLLAAVAGVLTHVPAGLGVLEAVFVACLGTQVAPGQLLAALLSYRAVYYLLPLAYALPAYALGEMGTRPSGAIGRRLRPDDAALG